MTLPIENILPFAPDLITTGGKDLSQYMRDLTNTLQSQYRDVAEAINGNQRSSDIVISEGSYMPELYGGTVAGSFTYTDRSGYVYRQGLLVDLWGDIKWSAVGGATGILILKLPYKVAIVNPNTAPFIGHVQTDGLTYTTGDNISINAISDTFQAVFYNYGSGIPNGTQSVTATGRIIFNIRYIGQGIEL